MILVRLENQVWAKTWPGTTHQACGFQNFFLGPFRNFLNVFGEEPGNAKNNVDPVSQACPQGARTLAVSSSPIHTVLLQHCSQYAFEFKETLLRAKLLGRTES